MNVPCGFFFPSICDMLLNWKPKKILQTSFHLMARVEFPVSSSDLTGIWLSGYSMHAHHGSSASDAVQIERWVSTQLHTLWLNGCFLFQQMNRDFFFFFPTELSDPPPPPILSLHPQLDLGQLLSESHMVQIESNASYCKMHTKPPGFNTAYKLDCLCEWKWAISGKEH